MEIDCYSKSKVQRCNKWGDDLPEDAMRLIMAKLLSFTDQARFRAVCRRWRQKNMGPFPPLPRQLPWPFTHPFKHSCKLFEPIYQKSYIINDTFFSTDLDDVFIKGWASKDGWLLMSHREKSEASTTRFITRYRFYFYNPFTRARIELPDRYSLPVCATFSSSPTFSDCKVFVVDDRINTCHPGDKTWTTIDYTGPYVWQKVIYFEGVLYCLTLLQLVAFNLSEKGWGMIATLPRLPKHYNHIDIIESGGELLLLCIRDHHDFVGTPDNVIERACDESWEIRIYKLCNHSESLSWLRVESLGKRSLFISPQVAISMEVGEQTTIGDIEADGVYCIYFPYLLFYSLKDDCRSHASRIYNFPWWKEHFVGHVEVPTHFSTHKIDSEQEN